MATLAPAKHAVTQYAEQVLSGQIVAGRLVCLAAQRHLRDVKTGHERGLRFDVAAADRALNFFGFLRLAEGQYAGQPFVLLPFQQFIVGSLFGWLGPDDYRRFRKAYVEGGRGSGKTPLAAAIGLYGLVGDREAGAQIYSAAVTRDQAGILFIDAKRMVEASADLRQLVEVNVNNLAVLRDSSFFRPVSSEARSLDGKRVHMALIDELHEHPSNLVVEKMQLGTKGRRQPLILEISNAGWDRNSVCYQHHDYSAKVLEGIIDDDGWFAYVCQLDPCNACRAEGKTQPTDGCPKCDDWRDPAVWVKTNPAIRVTVTERYLAEQVREAEGMPAKQNLVKRFCFCIWSEQESRWLDMELWNQGAEPFDEAELYGRPCYMGLDLSSNTDLTAAALLFPPQDSDERWKVLLRYWIPEEGVEVRVRRDRVPYDVWIRQGFIQTTPGNVVDKDFIEAAILVLAGQYQVQELAYDRLYADQLVQHLMAQGLTCVPFGMGFFSMAAPCKEFEALVQGGRLQHGGNPVLDWNISNTSVAQDAGGNKRPVKNEGTATRRIDGVVALLIALGRAIVHEGETGESVYNKRGILVLSAWDDDDEQEAADDTDS